MNDELRRKLTEAGGECWHEIEVIAGSDYLLCVKCRQIFKWTDAKINLTFMPDDYFWLMKKVVGNKERSLFRWFKEKMDYIHNMDAWLCWERRDSAERCELIGEWWEEREEKDNEDN